LANGSPPGSLQERWPKRTHQLSWYSAIGCIHMPAQCHHWWMTTLYHKKIWNGRTVCISIRIWTQWHLLLLSIHPPTMQGTLTRHPHTVHGSDQSLWHCKKSWPIICYTCKIWCTTCAHLTS
jgi:hypothetical protein